MIYSISDIQSILARHLDLVVDMGGNTRNFAFWGVYETLREAFSVPVELFEKSEILPGQAAAKEIQETGVIVYDR